MAHVTHGLIAYPELLRPELATLEGFEMAVLKQDRIFIYLNSTIESEIARVFGVDSSRYCKELGKLETAVVQYAADRSNRGPIAYVETEYFAGSGSQGAILWNEGQVVLGPLHHNDEIIDGHVVVPMLQGMPINRVLRAMGVRRSEHDEFDSLGLGEIRDLGEWTPAIQ